MKYVKSPLTKKEIINLNQKYGDYIKITADVNQGSLVAGCFLHADGEKILLEEGSKQEAIWGGGLNFASKEIDCLAVLNLRPSESNRSMEILDPNRRERFINTVKNIFKFLWEK
ncbi:MAG: DUF5674 family protein [Candidatus Shapirobacteria bacterium]|nr:DUF5674 family protein [Candidatus Shapirobacteria bacterium]